jgi:hypothetical protein
MNPNCYLKYFLSLILFSSHLSAADGGTVADARSSLRAYRPIPHETLGFVVDEGITFGSLESTEEALERGISDPANPYVECTGSFEYWGSKSGDSDVHPTSTICRLKPTIFIGAAHSFSAYKELMEAGKIKGAQIRIGEHAFPVTSARVEVYEGHDIALLIVEEAGEKFLPKEYPNILNTKDFKPSFDGFVVSQTKLQYLNPFGLMYKDDSGPEKALAMAVLYKDNPEAQRVTSIVTCKRASDVICHTWPVITYVTTEAIDYKEHFRQVLFAAGESFHDEYYLFPKTSDVRKLRLLPFFGKGASGSPLFVYDSLKNLCLAGILTKVETVVSKDLSPEKKDTGLIRNQYFEPLEENFLRFLETVEARMAGSTEATKEEDRPS